MLTPYAITSECKISVNYGVCARASYLGRISNSFVINIEAREEMEGRMDDDTFVHFN